MGSSEVTRVMAAAVAAGTKGGVEQRYQQPDYIDVSGVFPKQKDIKKQPMFTCLQTKEYCY